MPIDNDFQYADTGEQIRATVSAVTFDGLDGGGIAVFVNGEIQSYDGGVVGRLKHRIPITQDLDGDGQSDLVEALNAATADLGITITPAQFRDLIIRFAQFAVTNKANQE